MSSVHTTPLSRALAVPRYEIIPMRGAMKQARQLPAGTTITVTCSPTRGVDATVELATRLAAMGYTAVPHLAARRFTSRMHLEDTVELLARAGIDDIFVVGGDDAPHGKDREPFGSGVELIDALAAIRPDFRSIGLPCYPEGHAFIAATALDQALHDKLRLASYMVTQICFDPAAIRAWLERMRAQGVTAPVYIGIPGVIERRKLLGIALKIGLGDSTRFVKKGAGMLGQLAGTSTYTPDALVDGVRDLLEDAELNVAGFHLNSFNLIAATEQWRMQRLAELADVAQDDTDEVAAYGTS